MREAIAILKEKHRKEISPRPPQNWEIGKHASLTFSEMEKILRWAHINYEPSETSDMWVEKIHFDEKLSTTELIDLYYKQNPK